MVILTDASFSASHAWLGFVIYHPWNGCFWGGCPTPDWLMWLLAVHKARKTYIGQLEAAVLSAPYLSTPRHWLAGRPVCHYIDNMGALQSMIYGRSLDVDINRLVFVAGVCVAQLACDAWFDYVPSASNLSDLPTRLDDSASSRLNAIGSRVPLHLFPAWALRCSWEQLVRRWSQL